MIAIILACIGLLLALFVTFAAGAAMAQGTLTTSGLWYRLGSALFATGVGIWTLLVN